MEVCVKCGGTKNCPSAGCLQQKHYHCDCNIMRTAASETNKERFEERNWKPDKAKKKK